MTPDKSRPHDVAGYLKQLSPHGFLMLGMNEIAYLKPVEGSGRHAFALHAADGTLLSISEGAGNARDAARQQDLIAVTLQ